MTSAYFPNLFKPGRIGDLSLRNRLMMSLYPTKYVTDGHVNDRLIEFFRARAAGGVALIVLDGCCLDYPAASKGAGELRMDTDEHVAGLRRLLDAVHQEGARAFMHLNFPKGLPVEPQTPGAIEKKGRWILPLVEGADVETLRRIAKFFGAGAARAREIGYDGVEVQASWGDTVSQFLSPLSNKRDDDYGGVLENRARFLLEIVEGIKASAGTDFPLQIKLVADELCPGGFDLSEAEAVAGLLEYRGADSLLVTVGNKKTKNHSIPTHSLPNGVSVSYAVAVASAVKIPVAAMGKINGPDIAERTLATGHLAMVAMTRALIADPELPNKAMAGRTEDIRGCIYCLDDCADKGVPGLGRACVNNPMAGQEYEIAIAPAQRAKKVWVVGGGPAGMQAALTAAERGHDVKLFEKLGHLGGQFRLAPLTPYKGEVSEVLRWLEVQLGKSDVSYELNHYLDADNVANASPDTVVLATGATPKRPVITGIEKDHVYSARAVLEMTPVLSGAVVIVGGGELGCEIAELVADKGCQATIVEIQPEVLNRTKSVPRRDLLDRLTKKGVSILVRTAVGAITDDEAVLMGEDGGESRVPAQAVIYAIGNEPDRGLYHDLQGRVDEIVVIGDAEEPGNVGHALRTAIRAAARI